MNKQFDWSFKLGSSLIIAIIVVAVSVFILCDLLKGQTYEISQDSTYGLEWTHECPDSVFFNVYSQTLGGITITTVPTISISGLVARDSIDHWVTAQYLYGTLESGESNIVHIKVTGYVPPSPPEPVETQIPIVWTEFALWNMFKPKISQNEYGIMYMNAGDSFSFQMQVAGGLYKISIYMIGHLQIICGSVGYNFETTNRFVPAENIYYLDAGTYTVQVKAIYFTQFRSMTNWAFMVAKVVTEKTPAIPGMLKVVY